MKLKYVVHLNDEQRATLKQLLNSGRAPARKLTHARILLAVDQHGSARSDLDTADFLQVSDNTVYRVRRRFAEGGLEHALNYLHPQHLKPHTLSETAEAHLIALACTHEEGQACLSLRLLADKMVELGYVPAVSHETIRKTLKKTSSSRI